MKNSNSLSIVPLPAVRVWSLLALAALPSIALASPVPQVVTAEVVAVPTPASGFRGFGSVSSDQAGSWVAEAITSIATNSQSQFYGVLAGSGTTVPTVLRTGQLIGGFQQSGIVIPRVLGSRIAYTGLSDSNQFFSAWIDDQLIAQHQDLIGTTGLEWLGASTPQMTSTSDFFVRGGARLAGTSSQSFGVVVRYPAETLVLSEGDTIPGLSGPITRIQTFESSPDGNFWVAVVTYESLTSGFEEMAIIETGNVYTFGPSSTPANTENSTFRSLGDAFVDDFGRVVLLGRLHARSLIIRDGVTSATGQFNRLHDVDADGFALTDGNVQGISLQLNGLPLDRAGANGIDANGDGFSDAGYSVAFQFSTPNQAAFLADGRVLARVGLQTPGNAFAQQSLVIASLALPKDVVCQGVANSTGRSSSLRAVGVENVAFNDLQLQFANAPLGALSMPIASRTSGFVPNPGGSVGNLCLGGSIGRGSSFAAGGATTFRVFPLSLPQPNGSTAALAGETWFFQVWHRDSVGGVAASNFSSALAVTFR